MKKFFKKAWEILRTVFGSVWFKLLVTCGLFVWLWKMVDADGFLSALRTVRWFWVPSIILGLLAFWVLNVLSLYVLLSPYGRPDWKAFLKFQLTSLIFGLFTPSQIGEASILAFLKAQGIGIQKGASLFLVNKIVNLLLLFVSGLYFFRFLHLNPFIYLVGLAIGAGLLVVALLTPLKGFIRDKIIKRYFHKFYDFFRTTADLFRLHSRHLLLNVFVNLLKVFVLFYVVWAVFRSFGMTPGYFFIGSIYNLNRIVAVLPVTLNGLGLIEGGMSLALSRMGFEYDRVLAAMVFLRVCDTVVMAFWAVVALWMGGFRKGKSRKSGR
jgi:uncharacterized membrane protein YbhN (UPF0104 family)